MQLDHVNIATPDASPTQEAVLVASVPLTDEAWVPVKQGKVMILSVGKTVIV